jgi:archaellum component FlaG (FlaF/FlaG flagellin family)
MMTVALAGAAFNWLDSIQSDFQDQAEERLQTSLEVRGLQCVKNPDGNPATNDDELVIALKNTGTRDLSGSAVDVYVRDNNGDLYTVISALDLTDTSSSRWEWVSGMVSPPSDGFLASGGFGQMTVKLPSSAQLTANKFYTSTAEFTNSRIQPKQLGGCVAK